MSLIVRTIVKKRDGAELSEGEIQDFVDGVTDRTVTDEQAAALLMAICCRGMTTAETAALTFAMMRSGDTWDLSSHGFVADKHSTGGRRRQVDPRPRAAPRRLRREDRDDVRAAASATRAGRSTSWRRSPASSRASRARRSTGSSRRSAARSSPRPTRSPRPTGGSTPSAT